MKHLKHAFNEVWGFAKEGFLEAFIVIFLTLFIIFSVIVVILEPKVLVVIGVLVLLIVTMSLIVHFSTKWYDKLIYESEEQFFPNHRK